MRVQSALGWHRRGLWVILQIGKVYLRPDLVSHGLSEARRRRPTKQGVLQSPGGQKVLF